MKVLVAAAALAALLLGAYIGYGTGGVGGAILYGALLGLGGAIFGTLFARTALLLRHWWKVILAGGAVVAFAALTWGVDL